MKIPPPVKLQEADRLILRLVRPCWPGGVADKTIVAGRIVLKRNGLPAYMPVILTCTCPSGRCRLCN